MDFLWLTHVAATLIMVGVIWFVQVVHYPLMRQVGEAVFMAYAGAHARLTTRIVAPVMLAEGLTAVWLLWSRPAGVPAAPAWLGAVLLVGIWCSTACWQVPQHTVLAHGFDPVAHRALVTSNWFRTIAWSLRGLLVLWMAAGVIR